MMKSYIKIQVPSLSLPTSRGALPGPLCSSAERLSESRFIEETIPGGSITLELDNKDHWWKIKPPAFAHWQYYLPASQGKWARSGDEISICDALNKKIHFSLRQANKKSGRAYYGLSPTGRYELHTEWRRVPKPMPQSGQPDIWYGLAIGENSRLMTGMSGSAAVVVSANKWFTFFMPATAAGASKGYSWGTAFVLLTGYIDRGDLIAHTGSAVDFELTLGGHWNERAGQLARVTGSKFEDLIQFTLRNSEMLRALAMDAVQGTCVDYDEKQVIIADVLGASIGDGVYTYLGECVPLKKEEA